MKAKLDLRGAIMMTLEGRTGELGVGVTIRSIALGEQRNARAKEQTSIPTRRGEENMERASKHLDTLARNCTYIPYQIG